VKYNGNQWIQIAQNGTAGGGCSIFFQNELYCGGNFFAPFNPTPPFSVPVSINHLAKLQGTASLNESSKDQIEISPNPTSGILTVKTKGVIINQNYVISDLFGKMVKCGKLSENEFTIDISNFSSGIYILAIEGFDETIRLVRN
jgi:hypothetical protein